LQVVKGIGIWLQEALLGFEIPPPVSNAFPLATYKLPLNEILPLAFKRVFEIDTNLKFYFRIWVENFKPSENILFEILSFLMWSFEDTNLEILFTYQMKIYFWLNTYWNTYFWKIPIWKIY
jgi:hypothetical protein